MVRRPFAKRRGFVLLLSVLVLGAIGAAVATSILLLGIGAANSGWVTEQSDQARFLADSCAEQALQMIHDNTNFSGSGGLAMASGTCSYLVIKGTGSNRTINAEGLIGEVVRRVKIEIDKVNPQINIVSWLEVPIF